MTSVTIPDSDQYRKYRPVDCEQWRFFQGGFPAAAVFARDPVHVIPGLAALPVNSEEELGEWLPSSDAQFGVLILPANEVQEMMCRFYLLGIRAVWSLAPADHRYLREMTVKNAYIGRHAVRPVISG